MTQTKIQWLSQLGCMVLLMITLLVPSGGLVTVVVLANDSDQNSVVVTVGLYGSLMITLLVPSGGLVTVVVLANDSDQNSVVVTVGL